MSEPIGPSYGSPLQHTSSGIPNVPVLSKQMQSQTMALAEQLQKILDDPSLSTQQSFLNEVTANGTQLSHTVEQAILIR